MILVNPPVRCSIRIDAAEQHIPLLTGDDEVTFNAHTQTLTNKSLTTPTINAPKISGLGVEYYKTLQ